MEYLVITLKAIAAYFILMLIGVNLIGFVVRGFILADSVTNNETAKEMYGKSSIALPIVSVLFLISYVYALYHFFNIWILISGIVLMVTRVPDLLWEIKHGKKITLRDMPKNFSDGIEHFKLGCTSIALVCILRKLKLYRNLLPKLSDT